MDLLHNEKELGQFFQENTAYFLEKYIVFIKNCQKKGEVRADMKPEFLMAVITQMMEWLKKSDIHKLYDNWTDFTLEVNKFLFYGIMPIDKAKD